MAKPSKAARARHRRKMLKADRGRGLLRNSEQGRSMDVDRQDGGLSFPGSSNGLTAHDAARTARKRQFRPYTSSFRHNKVEFVSPSTDQLLDTTGKSQARKGQDVVAPNMREESANAVNDSAHEVGRALSTPDVRTKSMRKKKRSTMTNKTYNHDSLPFYLDPSGSGRRPDSAVATVDPSVAQKSDSSEDEVVFVPRKGTCSRSQLATLESCDAESSEETQPTTKSSGLRTTVSSDSIYNAPNAVTVIEDPYIVETDSNLLNEDIDKSSFEKVSKASRKRHRRQRKKRGSRNQLQEDESLADYLANVRETLSVQSLDIDTIMDKNGDDTLDDRDVVISDNEETLSSSIASKLQDQRLSDSSSGDYSVNEDDGAVTNILSKREQPNGTQYLVVFQGHSIDDARWVFESSLNDAGAAAQISNFESHHRFGRHSDMNSEEESGLNADSDEKIDSTNEVDEEGSEESDDDDLLQYHTGRIKFGQSSIFKKRREPDFSSTGVSFGEEDSEGSILPSERHYPWETVEDSDFASQILAAWEKDRKKKAQKKREREQLRAEGLLGKKQKMRMTKDVDIDIHSKYATGISFSDVKDELAQFLLSSQQSISFPAMDKGSRKRLHHLAERLQLKSKSFGSAERFTNVYKTKNTAHWTKKNLSELHAFLNRGSGGVRNRKSRANIQSKWNGGGTPSGPKHRDGDIVGASAPELGLGNKGRAMLEKMGWSSGTALGSTDNKGILEPVKHVVKTSRAGLG